MFKKGDSPIPGYSLIDFLGRGQYGEVWAAKAPGGAEVAMKFIAIQSNTGAVELKALSAVKLIRHPNLVSIHAVWVLDTEGNVLDDSTVEQLSYSSKHGKPKPDQTLLPEDEQSMRDSAFLVIAMAKADKSLEDRLKECSEDANEPGIPIPELLDYMEQAATGLDFLNEERHLIDGQTRGVIHRDVKPANLLLIGNAVVVGDFGVATTLKEFDATATSLSGSIGFMSPESINRKPSSTTDQYALAISYYWMRTNSLPYAATISIDKLLEIHRTGTLDFDFVGKEEQKILRQATEILPAKRFKNCREFVSALKGFHFGEKQISPKRSNIPLVAGIAVTLVVIVSCLIYFATRPNAPDPAPKNEDSPGQRLPIQTVRFSPQSAEYEIRFVDDNGETKTDKVSREARFPMAENGSVEIRSIQTPGVFLPLAWTKYSLADLKEINSTIELMPRARDELRSEVLSLLKQGENADARKLIRSALGYYPDIADTEDRYQTLEIAPKPGKLLSLQSQPKFVISFLKHAPQLLSWNQRALQVESSESDVQVGYVEALIDVPVREQVVVLQTYSADILQLTKTPCRIEKFWPAAQSTVRLTCAVPMGDTGKIIVGDLDGVVHLLDLEHPEKPPLEKEVFPAPVFRLVAGKNSVLAIGQEESQGKLLTVSGDAIQSRDIQFPFDALDDPIIHVSRLGEAGMAIATQKTLYVSTSIADPDPQFVKLEDRDSDGEIMLLEGSPDGKWLLIATESTQTSYELWDVISKKKLPSKKLSDDSPASVFDFSSNGRWAMLLTSQGGMAVIELASGELTEFPAAGKGKRTHGAFHSVEQKLLTIVEDGEGESATATAELWDLEPCLFLIQVQKEADSSKSD